MAFLGELIKPFQLPSKFLTDEGMKAIGAIGEDEYGSLTQKERDIIDRYYALIRYVIIDKSGMRITKNYYIPKESISKDVLPEQGMDPKPDPLINYLKDPWITVENVTELYTQCAIDGAKRAINYINYYKSQGKTINVDEIVPLVVNDSNSRRVYEGPFFGFIPIFNEYGQMNDASTKMLRNFVKEAITLGAQMVVDSIKEEMAKLQDQAAAMQEVAPATQEPMTAGVGTIPLIGIIALLGFSLKTIAQKRRK